MIIECVFLIVIVAEALVYIPFSISCHHKKTCSRKKCPFRATDTSLMSMGQCRKCPYPYDEEEEAELNATIERLEKLIDQLAQENKDASV